MITCKQLCSMWYCQHYQQCYETQRAKIDKKRCAELRDKTAHLVDAYPPKPKKHPKKKKVSIKKKLNYPDMDTKGMSGAKQWRLAIFERDNYTCVYCNVKGTCIKGNKDNLTIDHVIPQTRGGKNTFDNCVTACNFCNQLKGSMDVEIFKQYRLDLIDKGIIKC